MNTERKAIPAFRRRPGTALPGSMTLGASSRYHSHSPCWVSSLRWNPISLYVVVPSLSTISDQCDPHILELQKLLDAGQ
jgi:hypothetical protein